MRSYVLVKDTCTPTRLACEQVFFQTRRLIEDLVLRSIQKDRLKFWFQVIFKYVFNLICLLKHGCIHIRKKASHAK